jgi:hypothetical protein
METRTSFPDLAHMGMTMNFKFFLSVDATLDDLNETINLVLGKGGLKCDLCEFELDTILERFPWPFHGWSLGRLISFAPSILIIFEWNDFGRPFGVGVILNLNITSRGFVGNRGIDSMF